MRAGRLDAGAYSSELNWKEDLATVKCGKVLPLPHVTENLPSLLLRLDGHLQVHLRRDSLGLPANCDLHLAVGLRIGKRF